MPSYPTKIKIVAWYDGRSADRDWEYTHVGDGLYQDSRAVPFSSDPITPREDGTWVTRIGTVVRAVDGVGTNPTQVIVDETPAFKADTGKSRWTLLLDCVEGCGRAVRAVVRVLNFAVRPVVDGGKWYIPHSWRQLPNARVRYEDALHRHLDAIRDGETHDAESGESHWAHVATNALFLWELDNPKEKTDE